MIKRFASATAVAIGALLVNSAAALAASADPEKVGENVQKIVEPNAKAIWWLCLVGGLIGMAASRRASRAGGIALMLIVAGVAIYNPGGAGSFMNSIASKILPG